jgi:hypothetical protein
MAGRTAQRLRFQLEAFLENPARPYGILYQTQGLGHS